MLVATPGQTTSYLHNKKICHNPSTSSSKVHKVNPPAVGKLSESSSRTVGVASAFMKTLSVRINRGNEYLKNAVQRALNSTSAIDSNTSKTKVSSTILSPAPTKPSNTTSTVSHSKLNTVPPTNLHRYPDRSLSTSSTDSICREMCHFKPIRAAPLTSWKSGSKSRGSSFKIPKPVLAKRVNPTGGYYNYGDNLKYYILRPNPLVSIQFSSSSAFVCLDAKLKLNNISSSRMKLNTQDDDDYNAQKKRVRKRSSNSNIDSGNFKGKTSNKSKNNNNKKSIKKENKRRSLLNERPVRQRVSKIEKLSPAVCKVTHSKRTAKVDEKVLDATNSRKRKSDTANNSSLSKQRCLRSRKDSDKAVKRITETQEQKRKPQEKHIVKGCSPPLTRSRLKQKTHHKLNAALTFEGRPI